MRISVFGLGYVGSVSAACLAARGHFVMGVDTNPAKVDLINSGQAPIIEPDLDPILSDAVKSGNLIATTDSEAAIFKSDISLVCVGTPSHGNGSLDERHLSNACGQIGSAMAKKNSFHTVVIRSTILPGTMKGKIIPMLEMQTGWKAGRDFGICNNPEFMREGSAVHDFNHPPKTVIGESDPRSGDMVQELYRGLPGPVIRCPIEVGEMVKYANNAWHALKVVFANEIGSFCKASGIDSHQVMDIFCKDTKLNLSPYYLKPGFAFGGSCLPKDIRALTYAAHKSDLILPLLESILPSNRMQIEQAIETILATGKKAIGILGFSFKSGTDDLRESPIVDVIERLIGKGCDLWLYDQSVNLAKLIGANRDYIFKAVPHIKKLMVDNIQDVLAHAEVIVIGNNAPEFSRLNEWLRPDQQVIDFVRIKPVEESHARYHGISW
jgi:GDP-mannose 6-dehydrogenase